MSAVPDGMIADASARAFLAVQFPELVEPAAHVLEGTKRALAALLAASPPAPTNDRLSEAVRSMIAQRSDHYTARNGRRCSIEGDDGEMCWIVPFEAMCDVERALASQAASTPAPTSERAEIVAWLRAQATCGCNGQHGYCNTDSQPLAFADAIERGEHVDAIVQLNPESKDKGNG